MDIENQDTPTPRRVNSLKTVKDCENELARTYRELRAGTIETGFAKSCCYLLSQLVAMKRDSDLEKRITTLEGVHR